MDAADAVMRNHHHGVVLRVGKALVRAPGDKAAVLRRCSPVSCWCSVTCQKRMFGWAMENGECAKVRAFAERHCQCLCKRCRGSCVCQNATLRAVVAVCCIQPTKRTQIGFEPGLSFRTDP